MASNLFTNKKKKKMDGEGDGKISYKNRLGGKITMDTIGFSAGAKRFPMMVERNLPPKQPGASLQTRTGYGFAGRKGAERAIAKSEGKEAKKVGMRPSGKARKSFE